MVHPIAPHYNLGYGAPMVAGIQIRPSTYWPRVPDGVDIRRIAAHPLVRWLSRWFPIDPWIEVELPRFKDADAILHKATGVLFCSHAQAAEIQQMRLQ